MLYTKVFNNNTFTCKYDYIGIKKVMIIALLAWIEQRFAYITLEQGHKSMIKYGAGSIVFKKMGDVVKT